MFKLEFKARQQLDSTARASAGTGGSAGATTATVPRKRLATEADLQSVIHSDPTIRQQAMLHLHRLLVACQ